MAETSLVRMSKAKAQGLQAEGKRGAAGLVWLVEKPERFLNPVLLLVLVCQLVAASLVGFLAGRLFGGVGVALATAFEVVVIFVLGEALPKNWALANPERAALVSAPLVRALVSFPPVRLLSAALYGLASALLGGSRRHPVASVSEQELLALADQAVEEDVIETEEGDLIRSIIDFGDTVVREVMVHRTDMVTAQAEDRISEVLEKAMAAGFSRIPVYGSSIDDIVGIAYTKDLMRADLAGQADMPVGSLVRPAHFVPESKHVSELMREMQAGKYHMAIVVDEYGGTAGLVTLEDLIEELVGEIVDEFDVEEPLAEPLPEGGYRVNARMQLEELNELLHAELPSGDWDTVGGLIYGELGHVPQEGEAVQVGGYVLVAEKVQGRRIGRVRIMPQSPGGAGPEEGAVEADQDGDGA